jgi:hypothetical protein
VEIFDDFSFLVFFNFLFKNIFLEMVKNCHRKIHFMIWTNETFFFWQSELGIT